MPVYNSERFIREVIDCLMGQTYQSLQLIIADNASTDGTGEICQELARHDERITYTRHEQNLGATANYNFVANAASTEFFKWHSSNDLLSPNAIESCVGLLDRCPDVALVYPATRCFEDSPETSQRYEDDPVADQDDPVERFLHVIDSMKLNNIMNGVLRLGCLQRTRMLREFYFADRSMMAELALQGKLVGDSGSTFYRRMDAASATQKKSEEEVLKHFDPSWERPLPFTNWRTISSFWSGLWSSGLSFGSVISGSMKIARRAWWIRGHLLKDIVEYLRFLGQDLKRSVRK